MLKKLASIVLVVSAILIFAATIFVLQAVSDIAGFVSQIYAPAARPVFLFLVASVFSGFAWVGFRFMRLPRMRRPPSDASEPALLEYRDWVARHIARHPDEDVRQFALVNDVDGALACLNDKANVIIRRAAKRIFISTALAQNGRLDGAVMLCLQVQLVWQLAAHYRLRPTPSQLTYLYGGVAGAMLLASDLGDLDVSAVVPSIVSSVAPQISEVVPNIPGLKSVAKVIAGGVSRGATDAFFTLMVGIVAKSYCAPLLEPDRRMIKNMARQEAAKMLQTLSGEVVPALCDITIAALKKSAGAIGEALEEFYVKMRGLGEELAGNFKNRVQEKGLDMVRGVGESVDKMTAAISDGGGRLTEMASQMGGAAIQSARGAGSETKATLTRLGGAAVDSTRSAASGLVQKMAAPFQRGESEVLPAPDKDGG